jgi:predicted GNAT superfamily acetyltransferase
VTREELAAKRAAERAGVDVRELDTPAATAAAEELFRNIWRVTDQAAPVSGDLMRALNAAGNYVAGAYRGDTMVGAAAAFFTGDTPRVLHSHITGVATGMQGRSVGFALKVHQRAWAMRRGIDTISWTVDPLVRRNAYFNLARLAATVADYLPDFYGSMQDGVNANDASDRLLLHWSLNSDRVSTASEGTPHVLEPAAAALLSVGPAGEPVAHPATGPTLSCELPADIVRIRLADPPLAGAWRMALRAAVTGAMRDGYRVTGVTRDGSYLLATQ